MPDERGDEFFKLQQALAGRYSLERELGRGGMGIVYLAKEVSLDRLVALKILPPELAARPTARERFLHEARTAAKLSHPNIVPIFAVDEVDEFVLFAMAYIDGETLGERIRTRGPRPPSEVTRLLREVAWALAYAHGQGVVHRDVKPENILLESSSGRALVADFGIASAAAGAGEAGERVVSGTAEYMSPEQAKGAPVGPASDTYSLGIVGYYALSGKLPFEGSTPPVVLAKHLSEEPPPMASVAQSVPSRLARTIDCCLAKDPDKRFANDEELIEALGRAVPERRELPVALRVFVRGKPIDSGGAILYLIMISTATGLASELAPLGLGTLAGYATFFAGLVAVPMAVVVTKVRRLMKAGFGQEELVVAFKVEIDRSHEEGAFEFGHGPSLYERIVRVVAGAGLGVAGISGLALALIPGAGPPTLANIFAVSMTAGIGGGVLTLVRLQRRRDYDGQLKSWLWRSRLGRWVFKIAGLGLKRIPDAASATFRPTEYAIGMEADRLFEELPREMRKALSDLPDTVRKLEGDAQKMRDRVEDLNGILAQVSRERPPSKALEATPDPETSRQMSERRQELQDELRAARDATQQRLADAVAALETIRLSLLRMQAGSGSVESVTGDLAAAREVADDIDQLLEAQHEVEGLLQPE
jgi:serine/threonine-protein kinase